MTDVASLSFQIDTSQVPPAVDQLNKLTEASDKVRGSTRFLVSSFGDSSEALMQLASTGRASLASFVQISENLDTITSRLSALRIAAADTIGTLAGQGLTSALTTFQQQFDAMSTLFGTSAAQLEAFNKQATYLGMNSYQVTSALQRITEAMQNMTPAGQAIRGLLNMEGISTSQNAGQILQQVVQYASSHQQSQQAYNTLQAITGPIDPATYAALMNQPYRTIAQRRQEFIGQTLDVQGSQAAQIGTELEFRNQYNRDAYSDEAGYLRYAVRNDRTAGSRDSLIQIIQRQIDADKKSGSLNVPQEQEILATLQGAQPGSPNAISAEAQFAIMNPNNPFSRSALTPYANQELAGNPMTGLPAWWQRFTDKGYQADNQNYIAAAYDRARGNVDPGFLGIPGAFKDFALNTDELTDIYANRLGLFHFPDSSSDDPVRHRGRNGVTYYTDPSLSSAFGAPKLPITGDTDKPFGSADRLQQDQSDAAIAQQFGYGGFSQELAAQSNVINLQSSGPNSYGVQLGRLFGQPEGTAILNQQIGAQQFIAGNAARPGFDQLQQLDAAGFVADQGIGTEKAQALVQYAQSLGLDPGRWLTGGAGGAPLTSQQVMAGSGPPGAALTPGQQAAFQNIWSQTLSNTAAGQASLFQNQQQQAQATLGAAGSAAGAGDYQAQAAGIQAFYESMQKTGDASIAAKARIDAYTMALEAQQATAERATKQLQEQNDQQDKSLAATGSALSGGAPGAYGAASAENDILAQMAQFRSDYPKGDANAHETQIRRQQQDNLIASAQDAQAQAQTQMFSSQATLATFGQGSDARNRAQTELDFAAQLQTATGDTKTALENAIDSIVQFKDRLDDTNRSLDDLQGALSGYTQGGAYDAAMSAPPGQQDAVMAAYRAKAGVLSSTDPFAMLPPAGKAAMAPFMPQIDSSVQHAGLPPSAASFIGADAYLESSGDPTNRNGQAVGLGQFEPTTAQAYRLMGKGYDYRTDPGKSIDAMVSYYKDLMTNSGGSWSNPSDRLKVSADYGTIPHSLGSGDVAAGGAVYGVTEGQKYQAQQMSFASQSQEAQLNAELPFLRLGQTGYASLAGASVVNPNTPDPEKQATLLAQQVAAIDQLARAAASLAADTSIKTSDAQTLATAYVQGPDAAVAANAQVQADAAKRQLGSAYNPNTYQNDLDAAAAQANQSAAQTIEESNISNSVAMQRLQNNRIVNPYQRIAANEQYTPEQIDQMVPISKDMSESAKATAQAMRDQLEATRQTAAQLDVVTAKQQEVSQGMGQIGSEVEGTLGNLVFSYQHGPGAGRYAQQQVSNLLGQAGRSLFNTVIGNPISDFVQGNLSNAVNYLTGNEPTTAPGSGQSGTDTGTGGGTSGSSRTLGGIGSMLGSTGENMLLTDGLKSLGAYLFSSPAVFSTSALIAHQGATLGADAALSSSPGLLSELGTFFSSIFATGGAVSKGVRIPFAAGDVFTDPTSMPMALLGEAGPEAIMPLRRGADGKLGVAAPGGAVGGGGTTFTINAPITVGSNALGSGGQMSPAQQRSLQRQFHQTLKSATQSVIAEQSRPGGMVQPQS
jgi:hypothetical protein